MIATHYVTIVEDITELHLMQAQVNERALHDVLTGLPNWRTGSCSTS